jgi:hypothetical protein
MLQFRDRIHVRGSATCDGLVERPPFQGHRDPRRRVSLPERLFVRSGELDGRGASLSAWWKIGRPEYAINFAETRPERFERNPSGERARISLAIRTREPAEREDVAAIKASAGAL